MPDPLQLPVIVTTLFYNHWHKKFSTDLGVSILGIKFLRYWHSMEGRHQVIFALPGGQYYCTSLPHTSSFTRNSLGHTTATWWKRYTVLVFRLSLTPSIWRMKKTHPTMSYWMRCWLGRDPTSFFPPSITKRQLTRVLSIDDASVQWGAPTVSPLWPWSIAQDFLAKDQANTLERLHHCWWSSWSGVVQAWVAQKLLKVMF